MHAAFVPFFALALFSLVSSIVLYPSSKILALLFAVAGIFPFLAAWSNSLQQSLVSFPVELAMIYQSFPVIVMICLRVAIFKMVSGSRSWLFWIFSLQAIGLAIWVMVWTIGMTLIP